MVCRYGMYPLPHMPCCVLPEAQHWRSLCTQSGPVRLLRALSPSVEGTRHPKRVCKRVCKRECTQVTDDQKYGMIEAIAHLLNRDYEEIIQDFVSLEFIPPETDLVELRKELLPALKNVFDQVCILLLISHACILLLLPALKHVFDQALSGGGARGINFNELAGDLAQITFKFPFRIPPYFALVIRAIGVLEGIALVGNPEFAIIDEAFPYLSKRLLTDDAPRLRAALRYMVYGKGNTFDVDRLIELLQAFEAFVDVRDSGPLGPETLPAKSSSSPSLPPAAAAGALVAAGMGSGSGGAGAPLVPRTSPRGRRRSSPMGMRTGSMAERGAPAVAGGGAGAKKSPTSEALLLLFSDEGKLFRELILMETVSSVDAMSRTAVIELARRLALPPPPPFAKELIPALTADDEKLVSNAMKLVTFFGASRGGGGVGGGARRKDPPRAGADPTGNSAGNAALRAANCRWPRRARQRSPLLSTTAPVATCGDAVLRPLDACGRPKGE